MLTVFVQNKNMEPYLKNKMAFLIKGAYLDAHY